MRGFGQVGLFISSRLLVDVSSRKLLTRGIRSGLTAKANLTVARSASSVSVVLDLWRATCSICSNP